MFERIKARLTGKGRLTVYECRRCGQNVTEGAIECPVCGCSDIARYDIR